MITITTEMEILDHMFNFLNQYQDFKYSIDIFPPNVTIIAHSNADRFIEYVQVLGINYSIQTGYKQIGE